MKEPRIHVVATGGTISSHFNGDTWTEIRGQELVEEIGPIEATVSVEDAAEGDSASLTPVAMLEIARAARRAVESGADGVVITHGTDTMDQTAYLADLFLGPVLAAPVVVTGAMRPHSATDPDGPANLRAAIELACHPEVAHFGVVAVLGGTVHLAAELSKVDATQVSAFVSVPGPPVGTIDDRTIDLGEPRRRRWQTPTHLDTGVRLLTAYPEMEPELVRQFVTGSSGLVMEVFGALNLPSGLWPVIHELAQGGLPIVLAARPYATGFRNEGLDFLGVVGSAGRSAMKARLALMAAVGSASTSDSRLALLEAYLKGDPDA